MAAPYNNSDSKMSTLARYLEGDYYELKEKLRSRIRGNPLFELKFDLTLPEYRAITTERAKYLFSTPEVQHLFDEQFRNAPDFSKQSLAAGEVISSTELSVAVKMGVMGWLFGGAIVSLGTEEHLNRWFRPLKDLKFTTMFCMSELGHGSNVRGIETEAMYDPNTQEFVMHSPDANAAKMYIGNATQGNYAAVFAKLIVNGENKGPHCFIVPIREVDGDVCPGVTVTDLGFKEGLNGVDNGLISFDHVRIPRENLLNRYADVSKEGVYTTSIANDNARFNTALGALLGTRIALCFQAIAATKIGLEIAVKYSLRRRQFGSPEQLLMNYQTHQLRLMPALATTVGLIFASRYAGEQLNKAVHLREDLVDHRPLQALAAGLKAYTTWHNVHTLQACRECTGGMGYMEVNRIANLRRDSDVFVTFEGDNTVMVQQVTRELLQVYASRFGGSTLRAAAGAMMDSVRSYIKTSALAITLDPVTSVKFAIKALAFKEGELTRTLAARLLNKISSNGEPPFEAWNECLQHVSGLGLCHVQKVTLEQFVIAVEKCPNESDNAILDKLCQLYAVHLMYEDRAWFLEQHYITPSMSKEIRDKYIEFCADVRQHALYIVESFLHTKECLHAPIAGVPSDRAPWAYHPDSMMEEQPLKAKL